MIDPMKSSEASAVTAKYWGDAARGKRAKKYPVHWLGSPLAVRLCVNPRISGVPETGWMKWLKQAVIRKTLESGFVLGCGGGQLERNAARLGLCRQFHGVDISADAIAVARALAEREGFRQFRYESLDANQISLPKSSYDLILVDMSLHHIIKLEHVLDTFREALLPEGWLVLNEFVGPDRFQWTDLQLALATKTIRSLPFRLRRNRDVVWWKSCAKPWVWKAKRWTPERVAQMDPSESVRSSEIPRLVRERFVIREFKEYGGTLLGLILNNIVGNFTDSAEDVKRLVEMAALEAHLIQSGKLRSNYVLIVAQGQ